MSQDKKQNIKNKNQMLGFKSNLGHRLKKSLI
jgi:hypothetical protein